MKKTITATLALLAAAVSATAFAYTQDPKPADYRRTLFAPLGQEMLMFEAPLGMCFADPSKYSEGTMYRAMEKLAREKGDAILLGVFGPCDSIANIGKPNAPEGDVMSTGAITWANPALGEKTPLPLAEYIDFRAASFKEYVELNLAAWGEATMQDISGETEPFTLEDAPRTSANGVAIGFTESLKLNEQDYDTVGVAATTAIRHFPIEILFRFNNQKGGHDMQEAHDLVDKFLAQQIALNE